MAEKKEAGNVKETDDCVNLLYLASQKGIKMQQKNNKDESKVEFDVELVEENDIKTSDTVQSGKSEDEGSPDDERMSPRSDSRMAFRSRKESQKSINESRTPTIICPKVNCPEKIIICLDISSEMDLPSFRSRAGDKFTPLKLVKRALEIFVQSKHNLDSRHEYALIVLKESTYWVSEFTNNPNKLLCMLNDLNDVHETNSFDIDSLFEEISSRIKLPKTDNPSILPPPYIVRAIFIYGRSHCVPTVGTQESLKLLHSSPYFFLDALYVHEPPSEENQCEEIFDIICELDQTGLSYVLEVSKNPTRLYDCMAQLLAHPLQRRLQNDVDYSIESFGPKEN